MVSRNRIRSTLCDVLKERFASIANTSAMAFAFARNASSIPERVLVRHALEHVFRIRMFRELDALATRRLKKICMRASADWAKYAHSEAVHDRYFLRDLRAMNVTGEMVNATSPFAATCRLIRFIELAAHVYGPLPIVLYSFWAEQSSEVGSLPIIMRSQEVLGADATRGALAHRTLDENLDHTSVIVNILTTLLQDQHDLMLAARLITAITDLIGEYFTELDAWGRCEFAIMGNRYVLKSTPSSLQACSR